MANREPLPALLPAGWATPERSTISTSPGRTWTLNPPSTIEIELGFMMLRGLTTVGTYRRHECALIHATRRPSHHLDPYI